MEDEAYSSTDSSPHVDNLHNTTMPSTIMAHDSKSVGEFRAFGNGALGATWCGGNMNVGQASGISPTTPSVGGATPLPMWAPLVPPPITT